ncbi:MAG: hypothetical protein K0R57_4924 [Paenibacillaceae bacterium]|jgi:hypothetical protein|nr:hypothetical protein [Paenibacillaceae bacterium]
MKLLSVGGNVEIMLQLKSSSQSRLPKDLTMAVDNRWISRAKARSPAALIL